MRSSAILLASIAYATASTCAVDNAKKVDCGFAGITSDACVAKGCCWSPAGDNSATPWCFNAGEDSGYGYSLDSIAPTEFGFAGVLSKAGPSSSQYGADITNLQLEVHMISADTIRVKIDDVKVGRWQVPQSVIPRHDTGNSAVSQDYEFSFTNSPFTFEVKRKSDGASLFKSSESLLFKDQYIELTTELNSAAKTFGLGESARTNHALKTGRTYTLWAADVAALGRDQNLYSSMPFYVQMLNGKAHGVLLLNSNGMDVELQASSLTYKVLGGVVDLFMFTGPTPAEVVSQYTALVGRPTMMPYWSLGFHNCKYGYTSLNQVREVVANYSAAGIPLDTQWMDIDYMQNYRDFTTDASAFPTAEVASFVKDTLHANGQHFVPIVDPGIMVYPGYEAYDIGVKEDVFIKDVKGGYYLGQVWPGPTYFPDFLNPKSTSYWTSQLKAFHDMVAIDGVWIDMNELSNFCNDNGAGQVCANTAPNGCPAPGASQTDCCLVCSTVDSANSFDFPPYAIHNIKGALSTKTVAMSAVHYGNVSEYNVHNLYGLTEQIATNAAMTDIRGKRPFLLSRSSFPSTGAHSAKWSGDNGATWDDLKASLVVIMDFNMFGVPMIGADICGFIFDTTEELCARWIEVGAFYPFSRNHNALGQIPQELYLWPTVAEASRKALALRYRLLPHLYTLFAEAHFDGSMVAQALWATFPDDATALSIDAQFMLGRSILVSPVITQGATSVKAYFPAALWYSISGGAFQASPIDATNGGRYETLSTPLTDTNVHVRGGSIIAMQESAMTTVAARETPFTLLVALCQHGKAHGSLFWDDGDQVELDNYLRTDFAAQVTLNNGAVSATVSTNTYADAALRSIDSLVVLGANLLCPVRVTVNGVVITSSVSIECTEVLGIPVRSKIVLSGLGLKLTDAFSLEWV